MRVTKVYTRTGDDGKTALATGERISKGAARIEAVGTVDELNSVLGLARVRVRKWDQEIEARLGAVQNTLFDLGAGLATPRRERPQGMPKVGPEAIAELESWIDQVNAELPPLKEFILLGGGEAGATLHLARCVARRAERAVVRLQETEGEPLGGDELGYLNRLSDLLFVCARRAPRAEGSAETSWKPSA